MGKFRLSALILLAMATTAAWSTNTTVSPVASSRSDSAAIAGAEAQGIGVGIGRGGNADAQQSQTAEGGNASNAGNAQDVSVSSSYRDRLQAPSVSAPAVYASAVCAYGWSAGIAVPGAGLSGGKSKIDEDCNRREAARVLTALNPQLALKVMCSDPIVKAVADVDAGDCEYVENIRITQDAPAHSSVDMSRYATKEELAKAFKQSQAK